MMNSTYSSWHHYHHFIKKIKKKEEIGHHYCSAEIIMSSVHNYQIPEITKSKNNLWIKLFILLKSRSEIILYFEEYRVFFLSNTN